MFTPKYKHNFVIKICYKTFSVTLACIKFYFNITYSTGLNTNTTHIHMRFCLARFLFPLRRSPIYHNWWWYCLAYAVVVSLNNPYRIYIYNRWETPQNGVNIIYIFLSLLISLRKRLSLSLLYSFRIERYSRWSEEQLAVDRVRRQHSTSTLKQVVPNTHTVRLHCRATIYEQNASICSCCFPTYVCWLSAAYM